MILALVFKIIAKKSSKEKEAFWSQKAKHCIGEFTLYALLSFAYLAFLSLFIEVKYLKSSSLDYVGIALGIMLLSAAMFYLFFYAKADSFYTEFKEKFNTDGFGQRFYVIFIL